MKTNIYCHANCIVIGGTSDIAVYLIDELLKNGAKVYVYSRTPFDTQKLTVNSNLKHNVYCSKLDINNKKDIKTLIADINNQNITIDFVFNFIGILAVKPFINFSSSEIKEIIDTNLTNTLILYSQLLKVILKSGRTKKCYFVHVGSMAGVSIGHSLFSVYATSKHAIEGLFNSLNSEFSHNNIEFILTTPAGVNTKLFKSIVNNKFMSNDRLNNLENPKNVALGIIKNLTNNNFRSGVRMFPTTLAKKTYAKTKR